MGKDAIAQLARKAALYQLEKRAGPLTYMAGLAERGIGGAMGLAGRGIKNTAMGAGQLAQHAWQHRGGLSRMGGEAMRAGGNIAAGGAEAVAKGAQGLWSGGVTNAVKGVGEGIRRAATAPTMHNGMVMQDALGQGIRHATPGRVLGTGAAMVGGGLAAHDLYQGASGQWGSDQSPNNLGWQNQRATGSAGLGQMAGQWAAHPLSSAASLFHGSDGPQYIDPGQSRPHGHLENGHMEYDAAEGGAPTWSPRNQYDQQRLQGMEAEKQSLVDARTQQMREPYRPGLMQTLSHPLGPNDEEFTAQRDAYEHAMRHQTDQGAYGKSWYNPLGKNVSDYDAEIGKTRSRLTENHALPSEHPTEHEEAQRDYYPGGLPTGNPFR